MRFNKLITLCMQGFCLALISNSAFSQELNWVKTYGAYTTKSMAMDPNGDLICFGNFVATTDFDPSAEVFNLTSLGYADLHITKMDTLGNFIWAKKVGGFFVDDARDMALDAQGNIYLTGIFNNSADMNPGVATNNVTGVGSDDIFITKLDNDGNFVWAKSIGTTGGDYATSIAVTPNGKVIAGGYFGSNGGQFGLSADFDPGAGTYTLSTPNNSTDAFAVCLDSNGNFQWAKHISSLSDDELGCIETTPAGNVVLSGMVRGTADFNPTDFVDSATNDVFICNLNNDGSFNWLRRIDVNTSAFTTKAMHIDVQGYIHIAGDVALPANFAPALPMGYYANGSGNKSFLFKCDSTGYFHSANVYNNYLYINDIKTDGMGNKYITGSFNFNIDFDFSDSTEAYSQQGSGYDILLAKYNANNELKWVHTYGGTNSGISVFNEKGAALVIDENDHLYTAGNFLNASDFDLLEGTNIVNGGTGNSYVAKYYIPIVPVEYDFNADGELDINDLLFLLDNLGCQTCPSMDLDGDNMVTINDVMMMVAILG